MIITNQKDLVTIMKKENKSIEERNVVQKYHEFKVLCEEQDELMAAFWE